MASRKTMRGCYAKICNSWKGKNDFLKAQLHVCIILAIALVGNNWPRSYPRNDNHSPQLFWAMNGALFVAAMMSLKHEPSDRITVLSRYQTEEWKGWMQWAFILYHYYRAYFAYNEIRVFVSAYVWMTGFGNFLYFDKKRDFSWERLISMWLRINYFPLLLCLVVGVPLELFYIVPLHTVAFFLTFATCYLADVLETKQGFNYWNSRILALFAMFFSLVIFYETSLKNFLLFFGQEGSKEYLFRFSSDKYTAWVGMLNGLLWKKCGDFCSWAYGETTHEEHGCRNRLSARCIGWLQRLIGILLISFWYINFGSIHDKLQYNPLHPFVFFFPIYGWLMIRNSSKYLMEVHSTALDFFGKITLETYVLQFHLFMCNNVQNIPIVLPGSGADGPAFLKFLNMLLCGAIFISMAVWARKVTVTTQTTVVELFRELSREENDDDDEEKVKSTNNHKTFSQGKVPIGEEMSSLVKGKDHMEIELPERETKE